MSLREKIKQCQLTQDRDEMVALSKDEDPKVRLAVLKNMCPCKLKADYDDFWKRVIEMAEDPDDQVRYQVLHTLCDGSPSHLEIEVMGAIEIFNHDPNKDIRRKAHKVLAAYKHRGKWNIL